MMMKTRFVVSALLLCGVLLSSRAMRTDITVGDDEPAISIAINDMVRHEKRFLSTSDIFDIHLYPKENRLVVSARVDDEHHNHYIAIVTPKDTTVKLKYIAEEEKMVWISPVSKDTVITCSGWFLENYSISYSLEDVLIDYADLPNKMTISAHKLFLWRDDACPESKEIIDTLVDMGRVDFLVLEYALGWGVIDDGEEVVCYDLEALQNGRIKKYHHYGLWGKGFSARLRRGWFLLWHPQRD
jgi:hypothetical protein